MRRAVGSLLLVVAALLASGGVLLGYALTSEYGVSPNDDPGTDLRAGATSLLPLLLAVGGLCWLGLLGVAPGRPRALLTGAVVLTTAVACAAAVLLGQRALEQRCVEQGQDHSAACPGFTGPPG